MRSRSSATALCLALLATMAGQALAQVPEALDRLAATPPQKAVGATIGVICPSGQITSDDLQQRCNEVVGQALSATPTDAAGAREGLQAMAPEEDAVLGSLQVDADQDHLSTIQGRLGTLRGGGGQVASLNLSLDGKALASLGGAPLAGTAAGGGSGKWGVFVNGSFSTGDRDSTARESGFDFDSFTVTGGADYMLAPTAVAGLALGYTANSADIEGGGDVESDSVSVIGYASYYPSANAYVDATLNYTLGSYDQNRAVRYLLGATSVNQVAISDTNSTDLALSVQGGYDWFVDRLSYGVYGRIEFARTDIDGFTERMSNPGAAGNGLALIIDDQDFTSIPLTVGVRLSRSYTVGHTTWFPEIYGQYTHEFDNDNEPVVGRFVSDPTNTRFFLPTDEPDRDYFALGLRASAAIGAGGSAYLLYEALLGHSELSTHTVEAGLKFQF